MLLGAVIKQGKPSLDLITVRPLNTVSSYSKEKKAG